MSITEFRIVKRVPDVGISGEMKNDIDVLDRLFHIGKTGAISMNDLKIGMR
jgi:hypothetical protein